MDFNIDHLPTTPEQFRFITQLHERYMTTFVDVDPILVGRATFIDTFIVLTRANQHVTELTATITRQTARIEELDTRIHDILAVTATDGNRIIELTEQRDNAQRCNDQQATTINTLQARLNDTTLSARDEIATLQNRLAEALDTSVDDRLAAANAELDLVRAKFENAQDIVVRLNNDLTTISHALATEAERRNWCSAYEDFIDAVNVDLTEWELPTRRVDYGITLVYTVELRTQVAALNEDEAETIADRLYGQIREGQYFTVPNPDEQNNEIKINDLDYHCSGTRVVRED